MQLRNGILQQRKMRGFFYALDHFCDSADPLAAGSRKLLHSRRIHPSSVDSCAGGAVDPSDSGPPTVDVRNTMRSRGPSFSVKHELQEGGTMFKTLSALILSSLLGLAALGQNTESVERNSVPVYKVTVVAR